MNRTKETKKTIYEQEGRCRKCGEEKPLNLPGRCRDCDPYAADVGTCAECGAESYIDHEGRCNPCSCGFGPGRTSRTRRHSDTMGLSKFMNQ